MGCYWYGGCLLPMRRSWLERLADWILNREHGYRDGDRYGNAALARMLEP